MARVSHRNLHLDAHLPHRPRRAVDLRHRLVGVAVFATLVAHGCAADPRLVVVSVDGLPPSRVLDTPDGLRLPNLKRLLAEGAYARGVKGVLPTVTYPSHTTIVTGVAPDEHGVVHNYFLHPEGMPKTSWYWFAEDIRVDTLWQVAQRAGWTTAGVYWPVTVGASIDLHVPEIWGVGGHVHPRFRRALATPGMIRQFESQGRPYEFDSDEALDAINTELGSWMLTDKHADLLLLHFTSLDHASHGSGPTSTVAYARLEAIDRHVGRLRAAAGPDAVFAVVSDHGFAEVKRMVRPNVALRDAGFIEVKDGRIASWRAYMWSGAGVGAVMLDDPTARDDVKALLQKMVEAGQVKDILEPGEFSGGLPDAAFVITAPDDVVFASSHGAQVVESPTTVPGVHGFPPDDPRMNASFFVVGPGVPAGLDLGLIDMRDVGPTLAGRVGLRLPRATGRDRLQRR